jgi:hypothetical protein
MGQSQRFTERLIEDHIKAMQHALDNAGQGGPHYRLLTLYSIEHDAWVVRAESVLARSSSSYWLGRGTTLLDALQGARLNLDRAIIEERPWITPAPVSAKRTFAESLAPEGSLLQSRVADARQAAADVEREMEQRTFIPESRPLDLSRGAFVRRAVPLTASDGSTTNADGEPLFLASPLAELKERILKNWNENAHAHQDIDKRLDHQKLRTDEIHRGLVKFLERIEDRQASQNRTMERLDKQHAALDKVVAELISRVQADTDCLLERVEVLLRRVPYDVGSVVSNHTNRLDLLEQARGEESDAVTALDQRIARLEGGVDGLRDELIGRISNDDRFENISKELRETASLVSMVNDNLVGRMNQVEQGVTRFTSTQGFAVPVSVYTDALERISDLRTQVAVLERARGA